MVLMVIYGNEIQVETKNRTNPMQQTLYFNQICPSLRSTYYIVLNIIGTRIILIDVGFMLIKIQHSQNFFARIS